MSSSGSASGARRRLLLVSTNYAPEHAGIGPYATQIAEHWAAGGAEVHVLTGMPHYPAWRLDPAYAGVKQVEEDRDGVRVHRRGHAVPDRQTALRRALFEVSVLRGGRAEPAGMARPDAVFAQMPSLAGGVLAARIARRHAAPFVPIVQDLMGAAAAQSGIRGGGLAAAGAGRVERYALRRAALVGVIHDSFVDKVAAMGVPEDRIRLVRNWSHVRGPERPREEMRARLGWRPGQTVLLHAGNMGLKQGLDVLVEAARMAPEVRVVLMGDGNQRDHLRSLAGGLPNLDFMPPAESAEFPDVLGAADVLLVTQRGSVRDMSLPSKLTSYFAAGRPVIASVAADSGTAQEVAASGAGVVVPPESAADVLAAVRALAADPDRLAALAAAGPVYAAAHLSREAGLARIDALLDEVLTAPPEARRGEGTSTPAGSPPATVPAPVAAAAGEPPAPEGQSGMPPRPAVPPVESGAASVADSAVSEGGLGVPACPPVLPVGSGAAWAVDSAGSEAASQVPARPTASAVGRVAASVADSAVSEGGLGVPACPAVPPVGSGAASVGAEVPPRPAVPPVESGAASDADSPVSEGGLGVPACPPVLPVGSGAASVGAEVPPRPAAPPVKPAAEPTVPPRPAVPPVPAAPPAPVVPPAPVAEPVVSADASEEGAGAEPGAEAVDGAGGGAGSAVGADEAEGTAPDGESAGSGDGTRANGDDGDTGAAAARAARAGRGAAGAERGVEEGVGQ